MKGWAIAFIILIIVAISGVAYWAFFREPSSPETPINIETPVSVVSPVHVFTPEAESLVTSPLPVTGEARGTWYFEASFPVRIEDANGKMLGQVPAQAQGEWMTESFVPFVATLPFATSTTATGFLVLQKDNPSGLPEYDAEVRVPVRFR